LLLIFFVQIGLQNSSRQRGGNGAPFAAILNNHRNGNYGIIGGGVTDKQGVIVTMGILSRSGFSGHGYPLQGHSPGRSPTSIDHIDHGALKDLKRVT